MDTTYKYHLKRACLNRGWTFKDCDIGVRINGVKLDTLQELDSYIESQKENK